MDIHYNAFISYRHHPDDIKVAQQIHAGLEHYRIPRALKKRGSTSLRLFRDKEELPITSNLSDDIYKALRNSDFLIVICSPHTKQSAWVQREIETFLKFHDHTHVLTVLASGDPYQTIPEILLNREVTDPVTGQRRQEPIEPLSCDWRMPKKGARREELPRLAAALLGCAYDELRRRERQYRMHRLIAVFSVMLTATAGLACYFLYTSLAIQKNLEASLINQSQYLSSVCVQQLEEGDRLLAIQLALEALPQQDGERPYWARAEYALAKAVGVYSLQERPQLQGAVTCDALIRQFQATQDEKILYVADERNVLSVWELETYQMLAAVQLHARVEKLVVTQAANVLVYSDDGRLCCYNGDAQLLWEQDDVSALAMSADQEAVVCVRRAALYILDPDTGALLQPALALQTQEDQSQDAFLFYQDTFDLRHPIPIVQYDASQDLDQLICVNTQDGQVTLLDILPEDAVVCRTGTTRQGDILLMRDDAGNMNNGNYDGTMVRGPKQTQLCCYDVHTTSLRWSSQVTTFFHNTLRTLQNTQDGRILWQTDNLICQVDADTGAILGSCEVGASPLWLQVGQDYTTALLQDGCVGIYNYEDNTFVSTRYCKDDLRAGFGGSRIFVNQKNSTQVLVYSPFRDENWHPIQGASTAFSVTDYRICDDRMIVQCLDGVLMFDMQTQTLLWQRKTQNVAEDGLTLLGFSQDGNAVWFLDRQQNLICADAKTGAWEKFALPGTLSGISLSYDFSRIPQMQQDRIYLAAHNLTDQFVVVWDCTQKQLSAWPVCAQSADRLDDVKLLCVWQQMAYVWDAGSGSIVQLHTADGTVTPIREGIAVQPMMQVLDAQGTLCLFEQNKMTLIWPNAEETTVQLQNCNGVSGYLFDELFLALTDTGSLVRAHADTGEILGETRLDIYSSFFSRISDDYHPDCIGWTIVDETTLFLDIFDAGNLIQTKQWEAIAFVPACVGYVKNQDVFVTCLQDDAQGLQNFGTFARYRLQDIQKLAQEALRGYTMTQEQKEQYGLTQ